MVLSRNVYYPSSYLMKWLFNTQYKLLESYINIFPEGLLEITTESRVFK